MMSTRIVTVFVTIILLTNAAYADPMKLTDGQMDQVTAGAYLYVYTPSGSTNVIMFDYDLLPDDTIIIAGEANVVLPVPARYAPYNMLHAKSFFVNDGALHSAI